MSQTTTPTWAVFLPLDLPHFLIHIKKFMKHLLWARHHTMANKYEVTERDFDNIDKRLTAALFEIVLMWKPSRYNGSPYNSTRESQRILS